MFRRWRPRQKQLSVLVWHYHDDDVPGPDAEVEMLLEKLPLQTARDADAISR